ncbi:MAG: SUF system NifU family Fe-S cluster assembly protein [Proteobacteria bacterium]|nr:SUF system NifU family Fe-S cluster assembly protein [Pseudomonadota bacterium]MCH8215055.1 SUF system NifU family Fe-S cluster assembly protein [Pseudomonadota bacterium]
MTFDLRELYQEVILDHAKQPRNFGHPPGCNRQAKGHNPLCGDRLTVYLTIEGGVVTDAAFDGAGCAISMASASLMTEMVKNKTEAEAHSLFKVFHAMVAGDQAENAENAGDGADLGKLTVFSGVREYPVRVKCATLPWHAFAAALKGTQEDVTTEE